MKTKSLLLLISLALALPSLAIAPRTFKNADKSKSFEATLTAYDAKNDRVTVVFPSGSKKSFPVSILCQEDQDYIQANKDMLIISNSVRLKFDEVKDEQVGDGVPTGYIIEVFNSGKRAIENITLKYTLYYSQGDLNKGGTVDKTATGVVTTGKMFDSDTLTVETAKVDIVRKIKPPVGGG